MLGVGLSFSSPNPRDRLLLLSLWSKLINTYQGQVHYSFAIVTTQCPELRHKKTGEIQDESSEVHAVSYAAIIISILTDVEIETDPSVSYPTLETFLAKLENEEPARRWSEIFLAPLRWMGVRTLDDMCIVSPKSLSGFFNLSPIMIMDLYVHVIDTIIALQSKKIKTGESEVRKSNSQGALCTERSKFQTTMM